MKDHKDLVLSFFKLSDCKDFGNFLNYFRPQIKHLTRQYEKANKK